MNRKQFLFKAGMATFGLAVTPICYPAQHREPFLNPPEEI